MEKTVKTSNRKIVAALGVLCIILLAGLAGTLILYIQTVDSLNQQVAEKASTLAALNSQLSEKDDEVSSLNSQISALQNTLKAKDSQLSYLNSSILRLQNYLYLNVSETLVSTDITVEANSTTTVWYDFLPFAGYILVYVQSSSNTTYVELSYVYHEVNYHSIVRVGNNGTAAFPILPATVEIKVGNLDAASADTSIMAVYFY